MIKAALFDYGGVLSTGGRAGHLTGVVAERCGLPTDQVELDDLHNLLRRGLICSEDFFERVNARYPTAPPLNHEIYLSHATYVHNRAEPVYRLAEAMRNNGITTAIFSNVYAFSARALRSKGSYDGFEPVILSCDEQAAKPDPDFLELALERVGTEPSETLFIDDQERNLAPARELGIITVQSIAPEQVVQDVQAVLQRENGLELAIAA